MVPDVGHPDASPFTERAVVAAAAAQLAVTRRSGQTACVV
jgi:hypothetical protein